MEFLNWMVRLLICLLPFFLLLWIYPDTVDRTKQHLDIGGKKVPFWDHTTPEARHPNLSRWEGLYFISYFGLYCVAYFECNTGVLGLILHLIAAPVFVTDYLLRVFGLGNLALWMC